MVKNVHDKMNESTQELIKDTFLDLIEENGFNNVTIKNLSLRANINRGTFYFHYLDKFNLIEQMENQLLEGLKQYMHAFDILEMIICKGQNIPYAPLVQVFQYLKQNGRLLNILLGAKGDSAFPKKMKLFLKDGIFADYIENIEDPTISKVYVSSFATSAFLGIIEDWLNSNMIETPEEMAIIYLKIKFYGMNI